MNTSEEREETKGKLTTSAAYVQVQVHIQSIINLVYLNPAFYHWVTNQQQF